jgi:hypothetical protein
MSDGTIEKYMGLHHSGTIFYNLFSGQKPFMSNSTGGI